MRAHSDFQVTVAPHWYPHKFHNSLEMLRKMRIALYTAIADLPEYIGDVVQCQFEGGGEVTSSTIEGASVEIGDKIHHVHAHFVLNIVHNSRLKLPGLNVALQKYFDERLGTKGCHVRASLMPSSAFKNYSVKATGPTGDAIALEDKEIEFEET